MFLTQRQFRYFSHKLNPEEVELYWNTILWNLAVNLAYIFEPIFLYKLGFGPIDILKFYLIVYIWYVILVIPVTKLVSKIGYKHAIFFSTFAYVAYWLMFYQIQHHFLLFYAVPVLFALQKSFFWPPYNADVALSNTRDQRGREVGVLYSLVEVASIVAPVLGGLISYLFGFKILFAVSAGLMVISAYPLFWSAEIYSKHEFKFGNFLYVLKRYPSNFFAYWGYAEDLMLMTLWPIFIFLAIPKLIWVGIVVTVASIIAVMLMLYLGRLFDGKKFPQLLRYNSILYGLTWIFRFFANSVPAVLGFDALTRLGKASVSVPLETITFTIMGKSGPDFAIAYAVFNEFSLSMGKIFTALLGIWILSLSGSMALVFASAGVLTMFYGFLKK